MRVKDITQIQTEKRKLRVLIVTGEKRTENRDNGETEGVPEEERKANYKSGRGRNILSMGNIIVAERSVRSEE